MNEKLTKEWKNERRNQKGDKLMINNDEDGGIYLLFHCL